MTLRRRKYVLYLVAGFIALLILLTQNSKTISHGGQRSGFTYIRTDHSLPNTSYFEDIHIDGYSLVEDTYMDRESVIMDEGDQELHRDTNSSMASVSPTEVSAKTYMSPENVSYKEDVLPEKGASPEANDLLMKPSKNSTTVVKTLANITALHIATGRRMIVESEESNTGHILPKVLRYPADVLYTQRDVAQLPPDFGFMQRFPAIIIGARKAGTTVLNRVLSLHPGVLGKKYENPFFYHEEKYKQGLYTWIKRFPKGGNTSVNVIKCAEYFHEKKVPPRIHAMNPQAKMILIVRNPILRLLSDYLFMQRYKHAPNAVEKFKSLEEILIDSSTGDVNPQWGGLQRSLYANHYEQWLKWFNKDQILVLNGDDFIDKNPAIELRKVESFLGLEPHFTDDSFYYNATKGFYCPTSTGCFGSNKGHAPPTILPELVYKLEQYLKPWNQQFYSLTGIDFDW